MVMMVEVIVVLIFIAVVAWAWNIKDREEASLSTPPLPLSPAPPAPVPPTQTSAPEAVGGLGSDISNSVTNPTADKVPETNPFKAQTNPLKGAYQNPFE